MTKAILCFIGSSCLLFITIIDGFDLKISLPSKHGSSGIYIEYLDNPMLFFLIFSLLVGIFSVLFYLSIQVLISSTKLEILLIKHRKEKKKRLKNKKV